MSRLLVLALALVLAPALAQADTAPTTTPPKKNDMHRIGLSIGVGGDKRPATLELHIRPVPHLEIAFAGGRRESADEFTSFGWTNEKLGRSAVNARAFQVFASNGPWLFAGHIGLGLGHDRVTIVEHHVGPNATFEEYGVDDAQTGTYLRGDAGLTLAVGPVEARVSAGIEGTDSIPYVATSVGLSFW